MVGPREDRIGLCANNMVLFLSQLNSILPHVVVTHFLLFHQNIPESGRSPCQWLWSDAKQPDASSTLVLAPVLHHGPASLDTAFALGVVLS